MVSGKVWWAVGIAVVLAVGVLFVRFGLGGNEDDWIKDASGVWIKHGNPATAPDYVLEQQDAIACVQEKLDAFKDKPVSQCLGVCGSYSVDFVSVPRAAEDNLEANQCAEYRQGTTTHFIELNNENGEIARIV